MAFFKAAEYELKFSGSLATGSVDSKFVGFSGKGREDENWRVQNSFHDADSSVWTSYPGPGRSSSKRVAAWQFQRQYWNPHWNRVEAPLRMGRCTLDSDAGGSPEKGRQLGRPDLQSR